MSEYTPTEDELVTNKRWLAPTNGGQKMTVPLLPDERRRAISDIRAKAWDEGAAVGAEHGMDAISLNPMHANPYRED